MRMSIFRNTVWIVKGLREYTSGGFTAAAKGFNQADLDVDCKGKAFMITGAAAAAAEVTSKLRSKTGSHCRS